MKVYLLNEFFSHTLFIPFYRLLIQNIWFTDRCSDQQTSGADLIRARIRPVITLKLYARILQSTFAWK